MIGFVWPMAAAEVMGYGENVKQFLNDFRAGKFTEDEVRTAMEKKWGKPHGAK